MAAAAADCATFVHLRKNQCLSGRKSSYHPLQPVQAPDKKTEDSTEKGKKGGKDIFVCDKSTIHVKKVDICN